MKNKERIKQGKVTNCYLFSLCCLCLGFITFIEFGFISSLGWLTASACFLYAAIGWLLRLGR